MNSSKKNYLYAMAVIYLTSVYMIPVLYTISRDTKLVVVLIPVAITIINTFVMQFIKKDVTKEDLLGATILVKYGMISFYSFGSLINLILVLTIIVPLPFMLAITTFGLLFAWTVGWLLMMGSAPFSLVYLSRTKKENIFPKSLCIISMICQFFFVADVISIIVMCFKEKKYTKITIGVLIGSLILIGLIILGLILYAV